MAFDFPCARCGHLEEDHSNNLLELSNDPDFHWGKRRLKGYRFTILRCCETPLPKKYAKLIRKIEWSSELNGTGYVSSNPKAESRAFKKELDNSRYDHPGYLAIVWNPRTGKSWIVDAGS